MYYDLDSSLINLTYLLIDLMLAFQNFVRCRYRSVQNSDQIFVISKCLFYILKTKC